MAEINKIFAVTDALGSRQKREGPRMNMKDWLAYTVAVSLGLLARILIVGLR